MRRDGESGGGDVLSMRKPGGRGRALVDGPRQVAYGPPVEHWQRVAQVWSVILDHVVTPAQAALCMAGLKLVREAYTHGDDNLDDLEGYVEIVRRIES